MESKEVASNVMAAECATERAELLLGEIPTEALHDAHKQQVSDLIKRLNAIQWELSALYIQI